MPAIIGTDTKKTFQDFDINAQLWLEVNLAKGLTWHTKGAARLQSGKTKEWGGSDIPVYNYHTGEQSGFLDRGSNGFTLEDTRRFYTNLYTYLKYDFSLADNAHNFNVMVGYNQESEKYENIKAYRKDYAFDLPVINAGSSANWSNSGGEEEWAIMSVFGRLNYNYKERYLFEANMRYDGTSRIASENRWGVFPSFSVGWRVTEEEFIKNLNWSWLNNLKIRGSWGQLGNQNIGLYPYQAMIDKVTNYPFDKANETVGYQQKAYANRDIKWETTTITDVGADLQVFNGLNVTFDWYKKVTSDILRSSQVSGLLGMSAPTINNGEVENKGFEIAFNYNNMITEGVFKGLQYNAGIYFDRARNKLTKFGAEEIDSYSIKREGLPYDQYYMLECIGIFADEQEVANSPKQFNDNTLPGDLKYKDQNNDGKIDGEDRVYLGSWDPAWTFGLNLNATWKGFYVSVMFQGAADVKGFLQNETVGRLQGNTAKPTDLFRDAWDAETNPDGKFPRPLTTWTQNDSESNPSDFWIINSSYLRMKNFQFGYTLPKSVCDFIRVPKIRVYYSGQNLLTFTGFSNGFDPEAPAGARAYYPQVKVNTFGLNITF